MLPQELPEERLATTAQDGSRIYLHTAETQGYFRRLRSFVYSFLVVVFLCLPWIRVGGQPVLLLDIPRRHFNIFGLTFWGHDAPMLFLVFVLFIVTIGLITAIAGRGWCGWACPQTVFIDRFFMKVERWIEGDWLARQRLDSRPMNPEKFFKKSVKWFLFLLMSLLITHSFLAYFVGTDRLAEMVTRSPFENPGSFLVIFFTTAIILFDFGWFREQFCVIACPYGRFQSVLMDEHSLIVAYDKKRGEPRRQKGMAPSDHGDCVNCYRCVQVCPTGIDIRRGVQMECIACTACIDACDEVMGKIRKPKGLIRYDTEKSLAQLPVQHVRPRTFIYAAVILIAAAALSVLLLTRDLVKIGFVHARENPYQLVRDNQEVINHYKVNVRNQNTFEVQVQFELSPVLKQAGVSLVVPVSPLAVAAGSSVRGDLFITFPRNFLKEHGSEISILIRKLRLGNLLDEDAVSVPLVGPGES